MLVPWSGHAGCEIDDTDNRLLDGFALTFQVFSEDLSEPWRRLRLCPGDRWQIWKRCCHSGEVKQITADHFHLLPLVSRRLRSLVLRMGFGYRMNPVLGRKFRGTDSARLYLTERHEHEHVHEAVSHEHRHVHDEHHQHHHEGLVAEPHSHWHEHKPMRHKHPHYPDLHHRHEHERD